MGRECIAKLDGFRANRLPAVQDEEDGDWIAPIVPNPKCEEASGCGTWTQPKIRNPDYKVNLAYCSLDIAEARAGQMDSPENP